MKRNYLSLILLVVVAGTAFSQPSSFVCGPAYYFGTGNFENIAFSRTHTIGTDGTPEMTFGDLQSGKFSSSAAGILLEVNKKHFHMGLDLAFPLKGKFKNISGTTNAATWFDLSLAWGGYIKEKFGIMGGFSLSTNASSFKPDPNSFTDKSNALLYSNAATTNGLDYKADGRYYMSSFYTGTAGFDLHFMYAITEKFIARGTYSFLVTGIKDGKATPPDGTKLSSHVNGCRRFELGLFYQLSDEFGFFAKYTHTGIGLNSYVNTPITDPVSNVKNNQNVSIFPNQSQKMSMFTIGVMIPASWLGSREYQGGVINKN